MNWILENYIGIMAALGTLYAFASAVALLTPSDKDNTWIEKIGKFADRVGINLKGK